MKLKLLTSNIETFHAVKFNPSFNVIVGIPHKKESRSHNLGKTTILKLLKFVLFNGSKEFLNKIEKKYPNAYFSVLYDDGGEKQFSRSFKRRKKNEKKEIETQIDYEYFIRFQDEFEIPNCFKKPSYKGADINWKPRLIGLLGFNEELLYNELKLKKEKDSLETAIKALKSVNLVDKNNEKEIKELESKKETINSNISSFTLFEIDNLNLNNLVNEIDEKFFEIKPKIYELESQKRKITSSLKKLKILNFEQGKIESVFNSVNLYFGEQIKHSIEELNNFYNEVYNNRKLILREQLERVDEELSSLSKEADNLDKERASLLNQLKNKSVFQDYTDKNKELIEIEKKLATLQQQRNIENIKDLEKEKSLKATESLQVAANLAKNIDEQNQQFEKINSIYSEIMFRVLKINAYIELKKCNTGNIDFIFHTYNDDNETSELNGDAAKRVSSAAVDIAIRCIRNEDHGFIAQDGILDTLDNNASFEFVKIVKELIQKYDFQYIVTVLKDKLPENVDRKKDIILELDDEKESNLLLGFKF